MRPALSSTPVSPDGMRGFELGSGCSTRETSDLDSQPEDRCDRLHELQPVRPERDPIHASGIGRSDYPGGRPSR